MYKIAVCLEQRVCLIAPLGILDPKEQGVGKPRVPFWLLSLSLGGTDRLWCKEGWRLVPAGISSHCQPNGPRRTWWVRKLLSGDSGLAGSFQNPCLLRANPNLQSVWLKVLPEAPPRASQPASLKCVRGCFPSQDVCTPWCLGLNSDPTRIPKIALRELEAHHSGLFEARKNSLGVF